ncbi:MAG: hypothetical protein K2W96_28465 [Gemmataceae bacterium]|nr:hypothetical protein [Gemmataceae bacterium]
MVAYAVEGREYLIEGEVADEEPRHDEGNKVPVLHPAEEPARGLLAGSSGFKLPGMMDDPRPAPAPSPA